MTLEKTSDSHHQVSCYQCPIPMTLIKLGCVDISAAFSYCVSPVGVRMDTSPLKFEHEDEMTMFELV